MPIPELELKICLCKVTLDDPTKYFSFSQLQLLLKCNHNDKTLSENCIALLWLKGVGIVMIMMIDVLLPLLCAW